MADAHAIAIALPAELPSNGELLRAATGHETIDVEAYDAERAARYARREGMC